MNKTLRKLSALLAAVMASTALASCSGSTNELDAISDITEYVTLSAYKGVEISAEDIELDKVTKTLEVLEAASELVAVDRAAEDGDTVNIDFVGKIDGESFEGGSDEGYDLLLGSDSFIEGFEDGLIGASAGEEVTLNLTFPTEYENDPDLAGMDVVFEVTVNEVKANEIPEMTDEFVAEKYTEEGYTTVDQLNASFRDDYIAENSWQLVLDSSEVIKLPESRVKRYYDNVVEGYKSTALSYGMDFETLLLYMGHSSTEDFYAETILSAKQQVTDEIIATAIARAEGIEVTEEDIDAALAEGAAASGLSVEQYEKNVDMSGVKLDALITKVKDFVNDNVVIK